MKYNAVDMGGSVTHGRLWDTITISSDITDIHHDVTMSMYLDTCRACDFKEAVKRVLYHTYHSPSNSFS